MALAAKRDARMSVADFKLWAEPRPDEERWELLDGEPVLMAPPAARHQRIVTDLLKRLDALAEPRGCAAYPGLAILSGAHDDDAPYPDVVVHRGLMPATGYVDDPLVIVEVLSPSTMANDRGRKLAFYQTVPSLRTLLMVYQDEARIEIFRRDAGWAMGVARAGGAIDLPELGGTLAVSEAYARVAF